MKTVVAIALAAGLFVLIRRRIIHVDLSFFLFLALIALSVASISEAFIQLTGDFFGIVYSPIIVILIALFIVVCLVVLIAAYVTRLGQRQSHLVRQLAAIEGELEVRRVENLGASSATSPK